MFSALILRVRNNLGVRDICIDRASVVDILQGSVSIRDTHFSHVRCKSARGQYRNLIGCSSFSAESNDRSRSSRPLNSKRVYTRKDAVICISVSQVWHTARSEPRGDSPVTVTTSKQMMFALNHKPSVNMKYRVRQDRQLVAQGLVLMSL